MRFQSSYKVGKSSLRFAALALLASAATGCSSDATRFDNLFSKTDNMSTASIPQRQGGGAYGQAPIPQGDLNGGGMSAPMANNNQHGNGGYQNSGGYQNNAGYQGNSGYQNNGGYGGGMSPARAASAPSSIQRSELAAPSGSAEPANRQQAMAQPMPASQQNAGLAPRSLAAPSSDNVVTNTTKSTSGWTTANAPKVTVRPGESAASLSKRYGVPEKEILKANGGKVQAGQIAVIPTYGTPRNAAKAAADGTDLAREGQAPMPQQQPEQKVAVLPGAQMARDKAQGEVGKLTPPAGGGKPVGGTYTVKPGDSLAKISRATGTPIDQLKAANNLSTENIRIGQTLTLPGAGSDTVKTASIPAQPAVAKPAAPAKTETASVAPQQSAKPAEQAPAASASVSDVEKKSDVASISPASTGISKYRWPVNGAVVAGYGSNVNGSRNDGIDISVPEGTPIKAAENGVVIYAGNGLKQLGNTVLVRHDDGKVTVYGHAGSINVSRGQKVQRGQTLAASGMSGDAKRPQVHFEVRKDATPVNPVTFLE
ncbi:peptidoglycan DD-metalloendopeptidase family protein [Rhizobiales bacterium RZME27]|uniref:Peptidoglycan DD-metalloendopeptidase family protein n=1 Tax=Endobacterium cereale TaxID=2663029 RepID=A0A6A8AJR7_9HYPH|nr:peptidoglycan DD-metalloendopeptidase family protein [Endobacterium cereale]MEB2843755.1 peptidoglycan DD-metalloendopeptidase family protein [Endobacterium cereale]MQY49406.1 peptidoglycan DD-metalloendopeptidase family protein [Endobacterium cereale]